MVKSTKLKTQTGLGLEKGGEGFLRKDGGCLIRGDLEKGGCWMQIFSKRIYGKLNEFL